MVSFCSQYPLNILQKESWDFSSPNENIRKFVPDQRLVAEEESQKNRQSGMIQEMLRESNSLREELHNLRCLTQIKAEERGQKHRELLRAEVL